MKIYFKNKTKLLNVNNIKYLYIKKGKEFKDCYCRN